MCLKDALTSAGVTAAYFSVTHFEDYLAMLKICTETQAMKLLTKPTAKQWSSKLHR